MLNKTILITYPNSIGQNLNDLKIALDQIKSIAKFSKSIGGIHILPPYPSSGDRGFAPLTHLEIYPKFGDWTNIINLAKEYTLSLDLILNHISKDSFQFQDYLKNGENSKYKNYFINIDRDFPELLDPDFKWDVKRPRPTPPYLEFTMGENHILTKVWCTFSTEIIREQIDLNYNSPEVYSLIEKYIRCLCENGVKLIRLDAAPHVIKKVGTNCFFLPETFNLIAWIQSITKDYDTEILLEVHGDTLLQRDLAKHGIWVYDFALPLLTLHTIYFQDCSYLLDWLAVCPHNQFTTLDTHDGIGVIDVGGILPKSEADKTVAKISEMGGNSSLRASGKNSQNFDIYQINTTYYSALSQNDNLYKLARAIQFFTPGVPMVYYVGLMVGSNDDILLENTGNGRDINRHNFTLAEFTENLKRPVVCDLLEMMSMRNTHLAFQGVFSIEKISKFRFSLKWENILDYKNHTISLDVDLESYTFEILFL